MVVVASSETYKAIVSKAKHGYSSIRPAADRICSILESTFCSDVLDTVIPGIPLPGINPLCPVVKKAISRFNADVSQYLPKLLQVLDSLDTVPFFILAAGYEWQDINSKAGSVCNETLGLSGSSQGWEGWAGQAYTTGVGWQSDAASGIQAAADNIANDCFDFFNAALSFAVNVVDIITDFLNDIDSPEAIAGAVASAGGSIVEAAAGQAPALAGALAEFSNSMAQCIDKMSNMTINYMPYNQWPSALAGSQ